MPGILVPSISGQQTSLVNSVYNFVLYVPECNNDDFNMTGFSQKMNIMNITFFVKC